MNGKISFLRLILLLLTACAPQTPAVDTTATQDALNTASTHTAAAFTTSTASPTVTLTPTLASPPPGRETTFDESGNRNLTGTLYGEGKTAIVLANMSVGGQRQWDPFVAAVDKQKFTTVTFNYRNINDVGQDMGLNSCLLAGLLSAQAASSA